MEYASFLFNPAEITKDIFIRFLDEKLKNITLTDNGNSKPISSNKPKNTKYIKTAKSILILLINKTVKQLKKILKILKNVKNKQ